MKFSAHKHLVILVLGMLVLACASNSHAGTQKSIEKALREINHIIPFSEDAVAFLTLTACAETLNGKYLGNQYTRDRGIFQISIKTERWVMDDYAPRKGWVKILMKYRTGHNPLHKNLKYQIILARMYLASIPAKLPAFYDTMCMGYYWKKHWNTYLGAGTARGAAIKYLRHKED